MHKPNHKAKKALLKKIVGKMKKEGKSPIKMGGGLGNQPLPDGSSGGSNLGKNGIY